MHACRNGSLALISTLLDHKNFKKDDLANIINAKDKEGHSGFVIACTEGIGPPGRKLDIQHVVHSMLHHLASSQMFFFDTECSAFIRNKIHIAHDQKNPIHAFVFGNEMRLWFAGSLHGRMGKWMKPRGYSPNWNWNL